MLIIDLSISEDKVRKRFEDGPDWRMFDGFGFWPVNMSRIV